MPDDEKSMMDDLEDAFNTVEENDEPTPDANNADDSETADAGGEEQPPEGEATATDRGGESDPGSEGGDGDDKPAGEGDPPTIEDVPRGLPPAAREAWKDTPQAMRDAIAKRETDYSNGIQKYAENAKRAEQMDQTLAPFQQYLAMNGGAAQAIQGLLQSGSQLQMGSPQQKAQMVAGLISQFGVDIQALDAILVNKPLPDSPETVARQAATEQWNTLQQNQQQAQAQQEQFAASQQIQAFAADPKNEFYNDVRETMAMVLDVAAQQGDNSKTLEDAYQEACMLTPQVRDVMNARQTAADVARKKAAAASITGTPAGEGDSAPPESLRGAIEDAWTNAGRA